MKAGEEYLLRYLEGHDKRFVIPVYQRNYDWKREQCQQLFDDILGILNRKQETYFIGSIVSIHNDDSKDRELVIIDGQQRITTLSLILLAIHNLLEAGDVQSSNPMLKEQIKDNYLVNKYSEEEKRIRLKPIKDDNQAFLKLFEGKPEQHLVSSNITLNYLYFVDRVKGLAERNVTIDQLYDAIKKLMIVDIKLKRGEDNPQLIFESLNSTGKQLEESDLVRNFILMDKPPRIQEKFYDRFWHPIEKNTHYKVGDFIRDYLTYTRGKTPRKDKVYAEFKAFVQDRCASDEVKIEELLTELLKFSLFYNNFLSFNSQDKGVNEALKRVHRLQVTVAYPYLMDAFNAWSENIIDARGVEEILKTIEAFVFRRLICNVPTNALNKIFATLGRNIRKVQSYPQEYLAIFKYLISAGVSSNRYPSDEDFKIELMKRDVYRLKGKNQIHLFERLENYDNREKVDIEALFEAEKEGLSYEHIMPQTLTSQWKKELGDNHIQIHEQYLHTLGNATLTAYNPKLSNKPFHEKVNMEKGFRESRLWLNHSLAKLEKWGEEEIKSRAEQLSDRALLVWGFPQTSYEPPKKLEAQIGLYEEYNFTGTKPQSFTFLDKEYQAESWRELYKTSSKLLYTLDPVRLESLFDEPEHKRYLAPSPDVHKYHWKLADGVYLNINLSAHQIVGILKSLFDEYDLDESDYSITLREETAEEAVSDLTLEDLGL